MYATNPPEGLVWPRLSPRAAALRWILQQIGHTERQPPHLRDAAQRAQLHSLLSHSLQHVPFYRERLQSAGFSPDRPLNEEIWNKIPILTREEVQRNSESLRARAISPGHGPVSKSMTSGSTGVPLEIIKTELVGLFWDAITIRDHVWQERELSRPWHSIRYFRGDRAGFPSGARSDSWGRAAAILGATGPGFGLNILTDPPQQVAWLKANQPTYLLTYPSNLKALLENTRSDGGTLFPELRQIITISESVSEDLREGCRQQWGVPIRDIYSSTEVGYIALQAPKGDHYLVPDEVVRVELLDDDDREVAANRIGRVVATPLHNFAMPLIRYAIGDYAERGSPSPCGRTLPVINKILGRVRNMLSYPDGRTTWPLFSDHRFREVAPVRQFRVIQHAIDLLELQVTADRPLTGPERDALAEIIQDRVDYPFRIEVTEHTEIARSPSGKYEDFRNELLLP